MKIDNANYYGFDYPNPYYKTDHELYSVPESQFLDYIQREGTFVKDYWDDTEYRCFFRRNKDTNQTNDNISIYYPTGNGIQPGSIIKYYDKVYLILNQESLENRVYHRSDGLNADVMLNTYNKDTGFEISMPCFAYDLTGTAPKESDTMSVINGNVELMTGDNEMSRSLKINDEFNAMGNWYSIESINFKTGIARIGASIIQGSSVQPVYALQIKSDETYTQGKSAKLIAIPTINESAITNATLKWSTSNSNIVTITDDGNACFVGIGICAISCYWEEHNITVTVYVEVVAEPVAIDLKCEIHGEDTMMTGNTEDFIAKFYQADGKTEDSTIAPVWSLDVPSSINKSVTVSAQTGNTITIKVASGSSLVGKSFGINLTDENGQYHATKTVTIKGWF